MRCVAGPEVRSVGIPRRFRTGLRRGGTRRLQRARLLKRHVATAPALATGASSGTNTEGLLAQIASRATPEKMISRGVVGIYKDYLGRGPTHAVTEISP